MLIAICLPYRFTPPFAQYLAATSALPIHQTALRLNPADEDAPGISPYGLPSVSIWLKLDPPLQGVIIPFPALHVIRQSEELHLAGKKV
jgi:hypothetical protein